MSITVIVPNNAGTKPEPHSNAINISHIDPDVTLLSGTYYSMSESWFEEPLEDGLRLVLVQSGQLRCRVSGQAEHLIQGPMFCAIANEGDFTSSQIYSIDQPLRYTIIDIGVESMEEFDELPVSLRGRSGDDPRIISCPAPQAMQALASQIATCPMEGSIRDFYLGGKALELVAVGAQFLAGKEHQEQRITHSEIERLHAARNILVHNLHSLPTLDELASQVGMNKRKLTNAFRTVFGMTVFNYLQEYRLQEAHRMLCDERINVSTVAHRVGYSPAHFATVFKKRYGISPSDVR